MFVIRRHDEKYPDDDLYLTEENEYGTRDEAIEFDGEDAAEEMRDFQEYNSVYNSTGEYTYFVDEEN